MITSGKLTILLAMTLVFVELHCTALCAVNTCHVGEQSRKQDVPPCHRHQSDSSKQSPSDPCDHGIAVGTTAMSTQASIAPLMLIEPVNLPSRLSLRSPTMRLVPGAPRRLV